MSFASERTTQYKIVCTPLYNLTNVLLALQQYMPRLVSHYRLIATIFATHAASQTHIDASSVLLDLFFDVISDLTFGVSFNTLTTKQRSPIVTEFLRRQKAVGFIILHIPLLNVLRNLRASRGKLKAWEGWYDAALETRRKVGRAVSRTLRVLILIGADANRRV
jgi:hypothetical protein